MFRYCAYASIRIVAALGTFNENHHWPFRHEPAIGLLVDKLVGRCASGGGGGRTDCAI